MNDDRKLIMNASFVLRQLELSSTEASMFGGWNSFVQPARHDWR